MNIHTIFDSNRKNTSLPAQSAGSAEQRRRIHTLQDFAPPQGVDSAIEQLSNALAAVRVLLDQTPKVEELGMQETLRRSYEEQRNTQSVIDRANEVIDDFEVNQNCSIVNWAQKGFFVCCEKMSSSFRVVLIFLCRCIPFWKN